jgi:hypothetical protein
VNEVVKLEENQYYCTVNLSATFYVYTYPLIHNERQISDSVSFLLYCSDHADGKDEARSALHSAFHSNCCV